MLNITGCISAITCLARKYHSLCIHSSIPLDIRIKTPLNSLSMAFQGSFAPTNVPHIVSDFDKQPSWRHAKVLNLCYFWHLDLGWVAGVRGMWWCSETSICIPLFRKQMYRQSNGFRKSGMTPKSGPEIAEEGYFSWRGKLVATAE